MKVTALLFLGGYAIAYFKLKETRQFVKLIAQSVGLIVINCLFHNDHYFQKSQFVVNWNENNFTSHRVEHIYAIFASMTFAATLKFATVIPLHKSGDNEIKTIIDR